MYDYKESKKRVQDILTCGVEAEETGSAGGGKAERRIVQRGYENGNRRKRKN